jgi:hypothetical protein
MEDGRCCTLKFNGLCSCNLGVGTEVVLDTQAGEHYMCQKVLPRNLMCNHEKYVALIAGLKFAQGEVPRGGITFWI